MKDILHFHVNDIPFWNGIVFGNSYNFALNAPFVQTEPRIKDTSSLESFIDGVSSSEVEFAGFTRPLGKEDYYIVAAGFWPEKNNHPHDFHFARMVSNESGAPYFNNWAHKLGLMGAVVTAINPFEEIGDYKFGGYFYVPNIGANISLGHRELTEKYRAALAFRGEERAHALNIVLNEFNKTRGQ